MIKRNQPKRVTLPNGRTFLKRYRHVTHNHQQANVGMRRRYKQRDAPLIDVKDKDKATQDQVAFLVFFKKIAKNPIMGSLGKKALKELPKKTKKFTFVQFGKLVGRYENRLQSIEKQHF